MTDVTARWPLPEDAPIHPDSLYSVSNGLGGAP